MNFNEMIPVGSVFHITFTQYNRTFILNPTTTTSESITTNIALTVKYSEWDKILNIQILAIPCIFTIGDAWNTMQWSFMDSNFTPFKTNIFSNKKPLLSNEIILLKTQDPEHNMIAINLYYNAWQIILRKNYGTKEFLFRSNMSFLRPNVIGLKIRIISRSNETHILEENISIDPSYEYVDEWIYGCIDDCINRFMENKYEE